MARRPGVLTFIWRNFLDSLDRKRFQKTFVGNDEQGNKYYELTKSRRIVNRGFVPASTSSEVPPEWLTWLRGIRKLPPTEEEILANKQAREEIVEKAKKLEQDRTNEIPASESKKIPYLESTTISDDFDSQPRGFPRYVDYDKKQPEMS
ncbi:NADH:ubiquinone oxidoreductase 17.2 kDa subunit family protein [Wuchereria bancrofti]|uniref:NADH:ubiquinone oxidoreductase 17.2 kDa subunit family protein n=1 Tax=Wuchereria bancrofti TaxID=6293 RepID=J9EZH5_WUCBA|nr:NADH:ubiquinone oxidoreductase 17.2 kDa subunit family protein [Wuchereria bancrofti]VDM10459.1 unnamed protein product [Wuchereria bancrofti]